MVGAQSRARRRLAARFSRPEVRHMEMLLREGKDELSDPKFHQKLADEFNAKDRAEKKAIQAQQIQRWFLNRQHIEKIEDISSSSSSKEMDPAGDENMPNNAVQCFDFPEDDCDEISEGFVMEFEAKSYRDQAWYDVSTFLAHRVLTSGEVEVRVSFLGFGPEEDEWVNATKAVRDRSIPMEASECWRVNEGDILLCFREKDETAYHFDAHVVSIERRIHDNRVCSCAFLVRYVHDQAEEIVQLSQLCRRP
ncbi:protein SAWADEE HOMEODOMAIN HOMOLOG 2-like isoform X1 [Phalaenopsis equestris]|uniref:protein SAWADEE HOMEODOMAIN HOMOLOG 2-like isoform X1 n=1 Tax=Phalaenopsis equestris TaxID=78828 RepID=UPI0009E60928|nr:protein SAWADEE HOMEODOMAIN HOMOLOG 2-like isoform X1 [Phalaenopsis equestris]